MNDNLDDYYGDCKSPTEEIMDVLYKKVQQANRRNIEYLKILEMYYKRIIQSEDIVDAKLWASRMLDHALQVKDE